MEALVLLCADPAQRWTAPQLAMRLYITPASAAVVLGDLRQSAIVAFDAPARLTVNVSVVSAAVSPVTALLLPALAPGEFTRYTVVNHLL